MTISAHPQTPQVSQPTPPTGYPVVRQQGHPVPHIPASADPRYYDAGLLGDDFLTLSPRERSERFITHAQRIESKARHVDLTTSETKPCLYSEGLFRTVDLWFPNRGCFVDATAVWIWLGRPIEFAPARHSVVSPQRWRPPQGVTHRESTLPPDDMCTVGEFTVTSALRSLCDMLRFSEPEETRALMLRALREGLGEPTAIAHELRRFARQKYVARAMQRLIDATAEYENSV